MDFELLERATEESKGSNAAGSRATHILGSEKDAIVSPYAIRNLTEVEINLEKQLT